MQHSTENCPNCQQALQPDMAFCPHCGQGTHLHHFNLHYFIHEAVHYFTHADKGIFLLLKELLIRPGIVAANYLAGMRKRYFPPFTFFLICAGLMLFSSKLLSPDGSSELLALKTKLADTSLNAQQRTGMGFQYRSLQVRHFFATYSNFVNMAAAPVMVLLLWLAYKRRRYNYFEHLVANLYFVGFSSLAYAIIFFPLIALLTPYGIGKLLLLVYFIFEVGYRAFCYYQWMRIEKPGGLVKAILVSLAVSVCWILLSYGAVWLYIRFGG